MPNLPKDLPGILAKLEMMSHVSAANMNSSSKDAGEDIGGKRPPGGIDRKEDRHHEPGEDRVLRSATYLRERLARGADPLRVEREARASLEAWQHQPKPSSEPAYGSPQWKQWVADSPMSHGEIARKFNVSRAYVQHIRHLYRAIAA